MKEKIKNITQNFVIIFLLCFLTLFIASLCEDYSYYSAYTKEELLKFFSMKETLLFNMKQALTLSSMQMIVVLPTIIILEKTHIKNIIKILITLSITIVASLIYFIVHFTITF